MQHHLILFDRRLGSGKALERDYRVVAILNGTGIDVAVVGFLIADFFDAFGDVLVGNFRVLVCYFEILVNLQFDIGKNLEFSLEAQRLAAVEMHVGDIGSSDDFEILLLQFLVEKLGDQMLEDLLANIAFELLANEAGGRLSGAEARKLEPPSYQKASPPSCRSEDRAGNCGGNRY